MPSLRKILAQKKFPKVPDSEATDEQLKRLQLEFLRIQQGVYLQKKRVIIVFEGFDAAGKGGAIRRLVSHLDPRGFRVYPIAAPDPSEQAKHYLFRFWKRIPAPGTIAIFDRSWYGRVLVERVKKLAPKKRLEAAYREIRNFEETLVADGIHLIKIFLAIHKDEQLRRFQNRMRDPYKHWKVSKEDLEARAQWNQYVMATDKLLKETHRPGAPWVVIPADDKNYTRIQALKTVIEPLRDYGQSIERYARLKSRSRR